MAFVKIKESDALRQTLACLETLGGIDIVSAVRINTPDGGIPKHNIPPYLWPVVLEVSPKNPQMRHITRICILQMNSGYSGRGPMTTQKLMDILGFCIPDPLTTTFDCERFVKG